MADTANRRRKLTPPPPRQRSRAVRTVAGLALWVAVLVWHGRAGEPPLCIIGDARAAQEGVVPAALGARYFDADGIGVGVGQAAVGGWEGLGEAIVRHGRVWVRTTNADSPRYYQAIDNRFFQSNALVYAARDATPRGRFGIAPGLSATALAQELARRFPQGVLFEGLVEFRVLSTIAIAHAATHGKSVRAQAAAYYTQPMERRTSVWAFVTGVVQAEGVAPGSLAARLTAGIAAPRVRGELKALSLTAAVAEDAVLTPESVTGLGQVLGSSIFAGGTLQLYPAQRLRDCGAQTR